MYRESTEITIDNVTLTYIKPGIVQAPYVTQWIVQGFAPSFMSAVELDNLNSAQQFEAAIEYVTKINSADVPEDEKNKIWGSALITSEATIKYLYPCLHQCFLNLDLGKIKDEALNEIISIFFTDYFELISK